MGGRGDIGELEEKIQRNTGADDAKMQQRAGGRSSGSGPHVTGGTDTPHTARSLRMWARSGPHRVV